MLKLTLPNGMLIEGTEVQVQELVEKLGFGNMLGDSMHYFSQTKGWLLIRDMNTTHLRNAILKYYEAWVNQLHDIKNPKELCKQLQLGISNKTWLAMVKEYYTREEE